MAPGLYLAELLKGIGRAPGCTGEQWGPVGTSVSLFPLQGPQCQAATLAIGLLQGTSGPRLGLVPGPKRARAGVGVLGEPGCKRPHGCAS